MRDAAKNVTKTMAKLGTLLALCAVLEPFVRERHNRSEKRPGVVWSPGPGEAFILKNAEVVDVLTGTVLHKRGLLIRDGRIEEILTEKKTAALEGVKVLDAAGSYVIPGLINAHCHMLLTATLSFTPGVFAAMGRQIERNFEDCITHGVTTVRDVGSLPLLLRRYVERIEDGDLLGPRVYYAGSFINAPGGYPAFIPALPPQVADKVGDFGIGVRTPAEAIEAVEKNAAAGASLIKTAFDDRTLFLGQKPLPILDDASLRAVVEAAHERGMKVSAHHRFRAGFLRGIAFGLDGMEHLPSDAVLQDADVEAFVAGDNYIVPTVQVGWALCGVSRDDPYLDDPRVRQVLANRLEVVKAFYMTLCEPAVHKALMAFEKTYRDPATQEKRHRPFTLESKIFTEAVVKGSENLNKLYHAGALIGCGNDGGTPQSFPGGLGMEMVIMESMSDMKPLDVLQAATINNARILGVEDDLGTVARGKLADLVLLPGNPLDSMHHVMNPCAVFKGGKLAFATHQPELMVSP
ncbi:MAG: amidohydrolase family protein [Actinomycetota bacterium]